MKYIKINIKSAYLPIAKMNEKGEPDTPHIAINNRYKKEGDTLQKPVQKLINSEDFAKHYKFYLYP